MFYILNNFIYYSNMYKKENFQNITTINGYAGEHGNCVSYGSARPDYRTILNIDTDTCLSLCNNDDSCSGFSLDVNKKCTLYTPTFGYNKVDTGSSLSYAYKGDKSSTNTTCYIKNKPVISGYFIRLNIKYTKLPKYSIMIDNIENCKRTCDTDSNCNGFEYYKFGSCKIYNPTIATNEGSLPDNKRSLDPEIDEYINTYFKQDWTPPTETTTATATGTTTTATGTTTTATGTTTTSTTTTSTTTTSTTISTATTTSTKIFNPITDSKYTLLETTEDYIHIPGSGIGSSSTTMRIYPPVAEVITTIEKCFNACNDDSTCSAYTYTTDINQCKLYNHKFSNSSINPRKHSINFYNPVLNVQFNNPDDANVNTFIKPRPVPTGFTKIKTDYVIPSTKISVVGYGKCVTDNYKQVPYTIGYSSYSMCAKACNDDSLCAGFSYGNEDASCILHDPSYPVTIPYNEAESGTPLTKSDHKSAHTCYVKNTPTRPIPVPNQTTILSINKELVDKGCWENAAISPIPIDLDVSSAQSIWNANMTEMINITIPSNLVGRHTSQANLDAFNAWAINIAYDNGFDNIGYRNGNKLYFGRKGMSKFIDGDNKYIYYPNYNNYLIDAAPVVYNYDRVGATTYTLFGDYWSYHVFVLNIIKAEIPITTPLLRRTLPPIPTLPPITTTASDELPDISVNDIVSDIMTDMTQPSNTTNTQSSNINIVKTGLDSIRIILNDNIDNIDNITTNIKKLIDPENKYIIKESYSESNNTLTLSVSKYTNLFEQFINKEYFEVSKLIINIKYYDNIELFDPDSLTRVLKASLDTIIAKPEPTQSVVNKQSFFNKYYIIGGLLIGIIIIIYFIYRKYSK